MPNELNLSDEILDTPLSGAVFCAVDVETSGLSMKSRLVEVAAVKFDLEGSSFEFQSLVNPCEWIWPGASEIHGITNEMVLNAPKACDVMPGLTNFISGTVFIAHNAPFDVRMIANELARLGTGAPSNPVVCTIRLSRRLIPGLPNYRLGTLVEHMGVDVGRLHNALPDARAARQVFLKAVSCIPTETPLSALPGMLGSFSSVAPCSIAKLDPRGTLEELPALADSRIAIEMEYEANIAGGPVVVTPIRVVRGRERDYLRAYCHRDGITKTYRLDRILTFRRA